MRSNRKVTADEAMQMYLDNVKRTNPSEGVKAVIVEIEDELEERRVRPKGRKQRHRAPAVEHATTAR